MSSGSKNGFMWFLNKKMTPTVDSTLNATGVTKHETVGGNKFITLTFTNESVAVVDSGANGGHGALKLVTLPEGNAVVLGASTNLTITRVGTDIVAAAAVVSSIGTTATATDNATLTTTEANIVPSTAAPLTTGAGTVKGASTAVLVSNGATTAVPVFLNFAIPAADIAATDALLVSGTVTLMYAVVGDN